MVKMEGMNKNKKREMESVSPQKSKKRDRDSDEDDGYYPGHVVAFNVNLLYKNMGCYLSLVEKSLLSRMNKRTYVVFGTLDTSLVQMRKLYMFQSYTSKVAHLVENAPMECVKFMWDRMHRIRIFNISYFENVACDIAKRSDVLKLIIAHHKESSNSIWSFRPYIVRMICRLVKGWHEATALSIFKNKDDMWGIGADFIFDHHVLKQIWSTCVLHSMTSLAYKMNTHTPVWTSKLKFIRETLWLCLKTHYFDRFDFWWNRIHTSTRRIEYAIRLATRDENTPSLSLEAREHLRARTAEAEAEAEEEEME